MALTTNSIRTDLKCGKGAIPEGKRCHKGPATRTEKKAPSADPSQPSFRVRAENLAIKHGGTLSTIANVGSLAASFSGNRKLSRQLGTLADLSSGVKGAGQVSRGSRTGNAWQTAAGTWNIYSGTQAANRVARNAFNKRRDSVWAAGFAP